MPPLKTSLALLAAFGTVLAACSVPSMPEAPDGANSMWKTALRVMACPQKAVALWHRHSRPPQRI